MVAVALLTAALTRTETRDDLDPRSAAPGGSRALAQILRGQGVTVTLATRSVDAVREAASEIRTEAAEEEAAEREEVTA